MTSQRNQLMERKMGKLENDSTEYSLSFQVLPVEVDVSLN